MIGRREFITLLGGAAAWPMAVRGQQGVPVVGFVSGRSPGSDAHPVEGFRRGLRENGFTEGQNVALVAAIALRRGVPTIFGFREFATAGGLMSYGANILDAHRGLGIYTGRILKGEKPADLPVQQAVKVDLVINMATARALRIDVSPALLIRADEVIE